MLPHQQDNSKTNSVTVCGINRLGIVMCQTFYIVFHQLQLILSLNSLWIQKFVFVFLVLPHSMCEIVFEAHF